MRWDALNSCAQINYVWKRFNCNIGNQRFFCFNLIFTSFFFSNSNDDNKCTAITQFVYEKLNTSWKQSNKSIGKLNIFAEHAFGCIEWLGNGIFEKVYRNGIYDKAKTSTSTRKKCTAHLQYVYHWIIWVIACKSAVYSLELHL